MNGREEPGSSFGSIPPDRLVRLPVVDDQLRRSREPLPVFYGELSTIVGAMLRPTLEALAPGRVAIVCGEHGFREQARFDRGPAGEPRYRTDGATPWEVLVPVVVVHRPSNRGR